MPHDVISPVEKPTALNMRSTSVRSKLGSELYDLLQPDLPAFYEKIRDVAIGETPEDAPRGYYVAQASHRKMFVDLMKMANADVNVDQGSFQGDFDQFREGLKSLSTEELQDLVAVAVKVE